jgi:hypothetical protein
MRQVTPSLIEVLQSTLAHVERNTELPPDDLTMIDLKRSILRVIAELEVSKLGKSA